VLRCDQPGPGVLCSNFFKLRFFKFWDSTSAAVSSRATSPLQAPPDSHPIRERAIPAHQGSSQCTLMKLYCNIVQPPVDCPSSDMIPDADAGCRIRNCWSVYLQWIYDGSLEAGAQDVIRSWYVTSQCVGVAGCSLMGFYWVLVRRQQRSVMVECNQSYGVTISCVLS
jgi:hypothetical protein